ncbi:uncharacterized protein LOC144921485 isoform X3 [Branchiostoma floridae x Branchiostoma belcheri]
MCQYLNRRDERGKRPGDLGAWASQETIPLKNALEIKTVGRLCAEHTADGIHQGAEPSMRN